VKELIKNLKEAGGYDNSLILIVGDHGSHNPWEYDGTSIAYNTQVLMLAKPVGQQLEEIQFSDSRVSLADIPKSVAEELGIEKFIPWLFDFRTCPGGPVEEVFLLPMESFGLVVGLPTGYI
jgi:arylsulfatase A-like enzyme